MHRVVLWVQEVLVPWLGPSGMFAAVFLDSSFLSLPEISDLLVITYSAAQPEWAAIPILAATLGSLGGCSVLWLLGRRGGEAFLVRRFGPERVARTRRAFERWDVLALAVPAMAPPPMPFKVFVFSAGVFGIPYGRFAATLLGARGLRYLFWSGMGIVYGEEAKGLLQAADAWFEDRFVAALATAAGATLVALVVWRLRRRARAQAVPPV